MGKDVQDMFFIRSKFEQQGPRLGKVTLQVVYIETGEVLNEMTKLVNDKSDAMKYKDAYRRLLLEKGFVYGIIIQQIADAFDIDVEGKSFEEVYKLLEPTIKEINEKGKELFYETIHIRSK